MTDAEAKRLSIDVLSAIAPEADFDALPATIPLRDELDLDSMDLLNFISGLHERTCIDIPGADYPRLATLEGAVRYLTSRHPIAH